ncbi:MAG TPA: lysophospholipid acyltransferase family protein [Terriglobales bacterium]|nr:lysophospholipid acyltransferase family protein [Terriglobales bacterium]
MNAPGVVAADPIAQPAPFTWRQRLALWFITWAGYLAIRLICPTLRYCVSLEEGAPENFVSPPIIYSFWHRCVFPAAYFWRGLGIQVMTSRSFDGEYIARIIQKLGFVPVRGSSNRGAVPALLELRRGAEQGAAVAFTIDGPRGPRYVAKPGPVLLSRTTGIPMSTFHIALDDAWILNTWDEFMIPKPFSRALIRMSRCIAVPSGANDLDMERLHAELQASLDRVREFAEANVRRAGGKDFPIVRTKSQ